MLDQTTKLKLDSARQILVGKVPDPKAQVEQITTALIYKFMDDMDKESEELGGKAKFFTNGFSQYAWTKLLDNKLSGQERLDLYVQAITNMSKNPHIPQLFRDIFKGAFLPYNDPRTLSLFLKQINEFNYEHSEILGDAFEYLLSILDKQGDAGQFRTPRHIIDFIVEVVDPKKNETILDPACGTAGFLISAYKHILKTNKEKPLTPDEKLRLMNNLAGYDISPDMVKLALVNMYLHGFPEPKIHEYDTLSSEERWDETFDVILANPPFMTPKGGIVPHKRFSIQANRAEVLFVDYIAEHLSIKGRAGIIVPEGIIFQSANAYKKLRKNLIENWGLYAVVSLPSGVFQPYSGVKTSILLLDKEVAKRTDEILFLKVEYDGFDLGKKRRKIEKNDLPDCLHILNQWKKERLVDESSKLAFVVKKEKIAENGDYNLTGDRYRKTVNHTNAKWPMVELGEVCEIYQPKTITSKEIKETGKYKVFGANGVIGYFDEYNHEESEVAVTCRGATCGTINFTDPKSWITGNTMVLKPKDKSLNKKYLFYFLSNSSLISMISGAAQPQITRAGISSFQIPLPPLSVQEQIVAEIEQYQKVIDGAKQIVQNWKPSFRIDPSWEMVELGEVCEELFAGGDAPKQYSKEKTDEFDIPILSNGKDEKSLYGYGKEARVFKPSITISARGTIGYSTIQTEAYLPIVRLIVAIPNEEKIKLKFLKYIIDTVKIYNNGNSIPQLTIPMIKNEKIPLPPLSIQEQIVEKIEAERALVESAKKLIDIYEQKISDVLSEI